MNKSVRVFEKIYPKIFSNLNMGYVEFQKGSAPFGNNYLVGVCDGVHLKFVKDRDFYSIDFCPSNSSTDSDWAQASLFLRLIEGSLTEENCDSKTKTSWVDQTTVDKWSEIVEVVTTSKYGDCITELEKWMKLRSKKMFGS